MAGSHVLTTRDEALRLSAQMGTTVTVSHPIDRDFVYIEPHGAKPQVVLNAMASAVHASVFRDAFGWRVERTKQDVRLLHSERVRRRVEWLLAAIRRSKDYRDFMLRQGNIEQKLEEATDDTLRQWQNLASKRITKLASVGPSDLLPSHEMLEELCRRIGIDELASIPSGDTTTFEDLPVYDAKALPPHSDLVEAYRRSMDALGAADALQRDEARLQSLPGNGREIADELQRSEHSIARLRLEVRSQENMISVMLDGFDVGGKCVMHQGMSAGLAEQLRTPTQIMADEVAPSPSKVAHDVVRLSADALACREFPTVGIGSELPYWFIHPENKEPLDMFVREALKHIADQNPQRCVAINVSDSLWARVAGSEHQGQIHFDVLNELIKEYDPYEWVEVSNAAVWRPLDPEAEESTQADRHTLGQFVRRALKTKQMGLREVAVLYHDASPRVGPFAMAWPNKVTSVLAMPPVYWSSMSVDWYAFLGGVRDADWEQLMNGQTLTVGQLGLESEFVQLLKGARATPVSGPSPVPDIFQHPMELFSSSQLADAPLTAAMTESSVSRSWVFGHAEPLGWVNGESPVNRVRIPEQAVSWQDNQPVIHLTSEEWFKQLDQIQFRDAKSSNLCFTIGLPLRFTMQQVLRQSVTSGETFSFKLLTEDERQHLWESACTTAIADALRKRQNSQGGQLHPGG